VSLLKIDAGAEAVDEFIWRDRKFAKAQYGTVPYYWYRLIFAVRSGTLDPNKQWTDKARQKYDRQRQQRYELIANLAARAYELEHGSSPRSFDDLCPAYIKTIPAEFRSGTNAVYSF